MPSTVRRVSAMLGIVVLLLGVVGWAAPAQMAAAAPVAAPVADHTANPSNVTVAGSLQSELGCSGDWQADCAASHLTYDAGDDVWQAAWTLPADSYEYKAALNNDWAENYGLNAGPNGANIPLTTTGGSVKFFYDHKSHWITDNVNSLIATVPGDFQSELGCPGDWQPDCLRSWLQDPDGDGTYSFSTSTLPPGNYQGKVAINEGWDVNYGEGGTPGGANISFSVPVANTLVTFNWNSTSHVLSITIKTPGPGIDNNVEWDGLRHDSRDTLYRTPGGAVPAGTPVLLRFRTYHNDVTSVKMRLYALDDGSQSVLPLTIAASDAPCFETTPSGFTCDYWQVKLDNPLPANYWYRFIVADGTKIVYYADDTSALDGGLGAPSDNALDNSWALMVYDPSFKAPTWAKDAMIYQIFPDRFRSGNPKNDPQTGQVRYDDPVLKLAWSVLPEGYCRNYSDAPVTCNWRWGAPTGVTAPVEYPRGRDYYGGDLKGVLQQLDYLQALGVTTIYFNPIFDAKSNHRYDTADFTRIDPNLGTNKDFEQLVSVAKNKGIKIVLDGVFNHMSSDSPIFDRYHHYPTAGACEDASSPYRPWFSFRAPSLSEPSPCVPSTPGGSDTYYNGWFGFDSIPVINKSLPAVKSYFVTGPNNITQMWLKRGAQGWRMDVMGDSSFPNGYWESFRGVVKGTNPNALIIGELWQKDSTLLRFLRGDRADTTMNYRMRDAVIGLTIRPDMAYDSKGFADSGHHLTPSQFAARLLSIREDYPDAAYYALMNLLDSHDTERLRWTLTPGMENTADKELNAANVAEGKQRQKLASLIQFSVPGAPTVYYGDEVGMTGDDDPDDRRTYPWADLGGSPDNDMLAHYQALAQTRKANPVLTDGDLKVLVADDANNVLVYGRKTGSAAALVAFNLGSTSQTVSIPLAGYLPDGVTLTGKVAVNNPAGVIATSADGSLTVTLNPLSGLLLAADGLNLLGLPAPMNLAVTSEANRSVSLTWAAVDGAAGYNLYRSPLTGGGYERVNDAPLTGTSFTDNDLPNAKNNYYVVRSLNGLGIESANSNEAVGMPHLLIGWANLQWPPTLNHTISTVSRTENVYGQVWIDGATGGSGAQTLIAQLGYGPTGSNPASSPAWVWVDAAFNTAVGNNDEFKASLLPDQTGIFDYVYRYTTTNGRDWLYADLNGPVTAGALPPNPGKLTVSPSADTSAPLAPTGLNVVSSSPLEINLAWDAVTGDDTLYGYEVLRGDTAGGPYVQLALVTGTVYRDNTVAQSETYYYVVRAVDLSFNRSGYSNEAAGTAQLRSVTLNFNVSVPATTDATGLKVYIAGSINRLDGGLPEWNPGGVSLTRVDATHWSITFTGIETTQIEYKYTLGDWEHVEKDGVCGEIGNRQLSLSYGTNGTQTINDTVLNWRNVAPCGN